MSITHRSDATLSDIGVVPRVFVIQVMLLPWWRHQMETFSALRAICAGNSLVNSPHKGQWCGALMFSLICAWINDWTNNGEAGDLRRHRAWINGRVNNGEAGDLRRHRAHDDVIVMTLPWGREQLLGRWGIRKWIYGCPIIKRVSLSWLDTLRPRQGGRNFQTTYLNAFSWMDSSHK